MILPLVAAGMLAWTPHALAVILYSTATRNTSAPSIDEGLAAWNLQGRTNLGYLGTPISSQYFIAAEHIGVVSSITVGSQTYSVTGYVNDPLSDLRIYKINGTFSTYATLYNSDVDGSEVGKMITIFGTGTQRGSSVVVGSELKGWQWGTADYVKSWGKNVVSSLVNDATSTYLAFDFNSVNSVASEASLSSGDSSGGVFINSDGQWKLAGVNYGVDSPWSTTGTGSGFNASIFDASDLYAKNSSGQWQLVASSDTPVAAASYATSVSSRYDWIVANVPEPNVFVLLISGAGAASVWAWRRHSCSRRAQRSADPEFWDD